MPDLAPICRSTHHTRRPTIWAGFQGVYTTPHIFAEAIGVYTHAQPTAPYRGAGRPEATFAIERTIDLAALEMGIDRVELRRRNIIPKDALPFDTGFLFTYDSGDFERNMEIALEAAQWSGFEQRRQAAQARGRLRGIALVNAIEVAGGPVAAPNEEGVEIRFDPTGAATIFLGSHNHGQGHETVFRQIAVDHLGLDPERVRVVAGDTDKVLHGRGTFGSRTMTAGGTAFVRAARKNHRARPHDRRPTCWNAARPTSFSTRDGFMSRARI